MTAGHHALEIKIFYSEFAVFNLDLAVVFWHACLRLLFLVGSSLHVLGIAIEYRAVVEFFSFSAVGQSPLRNAQTHHVTAPTLPVALSALSLLLGPEERNVHLPLCMMAG